MLGGSSGPRGHFELCSGACRAPNDRAGSLRKRKGPRNGCSSRGARTDCSRWPRNGRGAQNYCGGTSWSISKGTRSIPGASPSQYPQQEHELEQSFGHCTTASQRTNTGQGNAFADRLPSDNRSANAFADQAAEDADLYKKGGGGLYKKRGVSANAFADRLSDGNRAANAFADRLSDGKRSANAFAWRFPGGEGRDRGDVGGLGGREVDGEAGGAGEMWVREMCWEGGGGGGRKNEQEMLGEGKRQGVMEGRRRC
jgi:hypothetical protein